MAAISLPPQQPVATATAGSSPICAARPVLIVMLPPFCGTSVVVGAVVTVVAPPVAWVVAGAAPLSSPQAAATRPNATSVAVARMTNRDRAIVPPMPAAAPAAIG